MSSEQVILTKSDLEALLNKPSKFMDMLGSKRFYAVLAALLVLVARKYGLEISETELLALMATLASFVLGDSIKRIGS